MDTVSAVFKVIDWATREECTDPSAAAAFLLEEMEYQGVNAATVATQLNYGCWELLPVDDANEVTKEGASLLMFDAGLCGLALIAWA